MACSFVVKPLPGQAGDRLRERPIAWRPFWWVPRSRPDGPSRSCCRSKSAAVGLAHVDRAAPPVRLAVAQRRLAPGGHCRSIAVRACQPCVRDRAGRAMHAWYNFPWSRTANFPAPVARALAVPARSRRERRDPRPMRIRQVDILSGPVARLPLNSDASLDRSEQARTGDQPYCQERRLEARGVRHASGAASQART